MTQTKQCNRCLDHKPLNEFYKHPKTKDRRNTDCIACMRKYYQDNKERIKAQVKDYQDNMPGAVYKITCTKNGKMYIGQSCSYPRRWNNHKSALRLGRHKNSALQVDFDEYGMDAFVFDVLQEFPSNAASHVLKEQEQNQISIFVREGKELYNIYNSSVTEDNSQIVDLMLEEDEFNDLMSVLNSTGKTASELVKEALKQYDLKEVLSRDEHVKEF